MGVPPKDFPNVKITTIEIDKEMVDVAKRYFELDKLSNHKVIVGDALRIIADPAKFDVETKSFDLIIVDIYCGNKYPDLGNSGTFFAGVRNLLRGKGLIVFNRIYLKNHQNEVDIFCDLVSQQFKDVKTKTVAGRTNSDNILIYGRS